MKEEPIYKGKFRNEKCPCGSGKKWKKCHLYQAQGFIEVRKGVWEKPNPNILKGQ